MRISAQWYWRLALLGLLTACLPSVATAQVCVGDCNGDGEVTVDELVSSVGIALNIPEALPCDAIDALHPRGCVELEVSALPLVGGRYVLSVGCGRGRESAVHLERVAEFHVWPADVYGSGVPVEQPHGLVVAPHRWAHRSD